MKIITTFRFSPILLTKIRVIVVVLMPLLSACEKNTSENKSKQEDPLNILFFLADDCTYSDIGVYGSKNAITPNIDLLASEGLRFTRCYQAAPMCSPTRHNILTGLYPVRSGAYPNHTFVYDSVKSIVQYLRPHGYRLALSGKRHISPQSVFDFEYLGKSKNPEFDLVDSFLTEVKSKKEPFALFLMSNEPHTPWNKGDPNQFDVDSIDLPPNFIDTEETRQAYARYLAEITYMDSQLGEALQLLEKHQLTDNTLVIFASEQGSSFPFAKWTLYEAGVKSGLIARLPGVIKAGSLSSSIVEYTDLLPTFMEAAGVEIPPHLDGSSLFPVMENPGAVIKDYAYSIQTSRGINNGPEHYGIRSIVSDQYRYISNLSHGEEFLNVVNNAQKKTKWYSSWESQAKTDSDAKKILHAYRFREEEELYDIIQDPWCMVNLAGMQEFQNVKARLSAELVGWMQHCNDQGYQTEMDALARMK